MDEPSGDESWCSVRCIYRWVDPPTYEERITVWHGSTLDESIELAEQEARLYAEVNGIEFLGLSQACQMDDPPGNGTEVFSLFRDSDLEPDAYLDSFFDTGREREAKVRGHEGDPPAG